MLNAPLIKYHIKRINKLICERSKGGYENTHYNIHPGDRMIVDDVQQALERKGYKVTTNELSFRIEMDISWKVEEHL